MRIKELALGLENSYIVIEHNDGKNDRIRLRRDKKRFNSPILHQEYYFLKDGRRIYVSEIKWQ